MDGLIQKYFDSDNKIEFFKNLSTDEQKNLFFQLGKSERVLIINNLSPEEINAILKKYPFKAPQRKYIYSLLSKKQMIEIYNLLDDSEKEQMINDVESLKSILSQLIEQQQKNLEHYSKIIPESKTKSEEAKPKISKLNDEATRVGNFLDNAMYTIKIVSKEKEKLLKKRLKISSKIPSRLTVINNKRMKKIQALTKELERKGRQLQRLHAEKQDLSNKYNKLKRTIEEEKKAVEASKKMEKDSRESIKQTTKKIKGNIVLIRELTQFEKKVLSRKAYSKLRNRELDSLQEQREQSPDRTRPAESPIQAPPVRESQPERVEHPVESQEQREQSPERRRPTEPPTQAPPVRESQPERVVTPKPKVTVHKVPSSKVKLVKKHDGYQIVKSEDINESVKIVEKLVPVIQMLIDNGVQFKEPSEVVSSNNPNLTSAPIATLNANQLVALSYAIEHLYQQALQKNNTEGVRKSPSNKAFADTISLGPVIAFIALFILLVVIIMKI